MHNKSWHNKTISSVKIESTATSHPIGLKTERQPIRKEKINDTEQLLGGQNYDPGNKVALSAQTHLADYESFFAGVLVE